MRKTADKVINYSYSVTMTFDEYCLFAETIEVRPPCVDDSSNSTNTSINRLQNRELHTEIYLFIVFFKHI